MAGKTRLLETIRRAKERRERKPRPEAVDLSLFPPHKLTDLARQHQDVCMCIEGNLLQAAMNDSRVDDAALFRALRCGLIGEIPEDEVLVPIVKRLLKARLFIEDYSKGDWNIAGRVVLSSIRKHSSLAPGDKSYQFFLLPFLGPMLQKPDAEGSHLKAFLWAEVDGSEVRLLQQVEPEDEDDAPA